MCTAPPVPFGMGGFVVCRGCACARCACTVVPMTDTENANPDTTDWPLTHEDCANGPEGCDGDVAQYTSRSGATVSARCDRHQDAYDAHMDEVEAGLNARYPGWDIPGSSAPADFDPTYAGESWDED